MGEQNKILLNKVKLKTVDLETEINFNMQKVANYNYYICTLKELLEIVKDINSIEQLKSELQLTRSNIYKCKKRITKLTASKQTMFNVYTKINERGLSEEQAQC